MIPSPNKESQEPRDISPASRPVSQADALAVLSRILEQIEKMINKDDAQNG